MTFQQIPQLVAQHFTEPDPIEIDYTIHFGKIGEGEVVRDVQIPVTDDPKATVLALGESHSKEIEQLDHQLTEIVNQVHLHKKKRDFMVQFAKDPVLFIDQWIAGQVRDYKVKKLKILRKF